MLQDKEIVVTMNNGVQYLALKKDKVIVKSDQATYTLQLDDFKELYCDNTFYLYEPDSIEELNSEKDQEYYSWSHK